MKKCYLFGLIAIVFIFNSITCMAVDFTLANGANINLLAKQGQWQLFVYINSSCPYCQREITILNKLITNNAPQIAVFGFNIEQLTAVRLKDFVRQENIKFPMLQQNPASFLGIANITVVPTMVLIKPNGDILAPITGLCSLEQLEAILKG